jgi:acylphosphatase
MPTIHLLIKGKVQGVNYRAAAKNRATSLALTGWVRNTAEGNVEAGVTGDNEAIQQFVEWCRQGPPRAAVTDVEVLSMPDISFPAFFIVR